MRELRIADGTALVLQPYFGGAPRPGRIALGQAAALRRAGPLAVVMDASIGGFRREIDPTYKAHRAAPDEALLAEFAGFEQGVRALGVPVLMDPRWEADDLAASLARRAAAAGLDVRIYSDDKDLFQLVRESPGVLVEDRRRGRIFDAAAVKEKLGVWPGQVVDFLALVGDASDGVAGVPGIGAKTAAALLEALGSLDAIYADTDAVGRLKVRGAAGLPAKLEAGRAAAELARRLVRLVDDIEIGESVLAEAGL